MAISGEIIGLVSARGGSKGLPRKNLMLLGGETLIARTIRIAKEAGRLDRVVVSTDDPEIADEAKDAGAEVPFMRPAGLAVDTVGHWPVWQTALTIYQKNIQVA